MKKNLFGIQKKLLLYSTLLIVVVVLIFTVIVLRMFNNEQETIKNQYISVTENILIKFDSFYEDMSDMTENIILDSYIQSIISKDRLTLVERESFEKTIAYSNRNSMTYYFVNSSGEVYSNRNMSLNKEVYENSMLYKKLATDYAKLHFVWSAEDVFGMDSNNLYVCRNIQSLERVQDEAKVYFLVNKELIRNIMPSENGLEQIYMIFSDDEEVCFSMSGKGDDVNSEIREDVRQILLRNKVVTDRNTIYMIETMDGLLCAGYHAATGFTVVTFVSRGSVNQLLRETFVWVLIVLLIGLMAAFILSIYFSRTFSRPIQKISNIMDNFGMESLDGTIKINTNTELDRIGNAYNVMVGNIKDLMNAITKKENEMRELEMETLLYQIQPHFLYNTLNNVYMLARINKQQQIMEMVDALSRFLQITLSNGKEIISVKQELEHACAYMKIQQIRNSDLFSYEVSCNEMLYPYAIPKMILQPLIENCIKHGFADIMKSGKIGIHILEENTKLVFEVSNNGRTMDNATVKKMNSLLQCDDVQWENNSSKTGGGYGVVNVARRLKLKYEKFVELKYMVKDDTTICRIEFDKEALGKESVT